MKHLKLFFALFAMLALNVGNAWGAEETLSCSKGTVNNNSMTFSTDHFTIVHSKGDGSSFSAYTPWRVYANNTVTISAKTGVTSIDKIEIVHSGTYYSTITTSSGTVQMANTSGGTTTISSVMGTEVTLTVTGTSQSRWTSIKITYAADAGGSTEPAVTSIQIDGELKNKTYEEGEELDFTGLTVLANYESGDPKDVTNEVVWSYKPNPLTKGTTSVEVTATYEEKTATTTITGLTVNEHVVTPGTYTSNLNNTFFGCTTGEIAAEQSGKFNDVFVVAGCNSSATSNTNYQSGHVRFYADSYLTLSVPTGYVINSIVFTEPTSDKKWGGSITVSAGTYTDGTKSWAGNAQEVKFSFAAQNRIASVEVTYIKDVKYALNITTPSNGTLVVKDGSAVLADGDQVYEGTKLVVTPTPKAGYVFESLTVDGSAVELTDGTYTFNMPASDVTVSATFKVNEKPNATLTLSKNGVEEPFPGSWKQDDVVTLPSITSDCVKEFVGWSANPTCNESPKYKAGDKYPLAETAQTLYAVYATVEGGENVTITPSAVSVSKDPYTFTIDATGYSMTANKNTGSTAPTYNTSDKDVRVYAKGTLTLTAPARMSTIVFNISKQGKKRLAPITASVGTIATQASGDATVTWTGDATAVTFTVGDKADFGSDGSSNAGQLCFETISVTTAGSYSDYSTTCTAALDAPTFSPAEGKYTEAKNVTISATEGTIYYTLDGNKPTASSTPYTGAIALNDCGEYTIKAIAISAESQSDVVSATYTIKLPLTNSQAAPYTEAEAIDVYNGGCYDNQDVYVKGTVKTATFYNSGTYTITLNNGFQFYKFYKDGSKATFTDGEINVGDVLVACGKLSKYNTTYQLAEGCYLVEHEPYTEPKTDISNTETTAYTVDKAFELIADVKSDLTKEVYVKGLIAVAPTSNPNADGQMTYSISDNGENIGDVLKVYLGLNLNGEKFTNKNDVQLGDYVVVKGQLLNYNGTYELNKGNQLVQHKKVATITIADITMEVDEVKNISATVEPAEAEVTYTIKENTGNAISLSGNTITARAVGTATITATVENGATYMGNSVDFTVTVGPKTEKTDVVILAQHAGNWYAMMAQCPTGETNRLAALPVDYFNGTLYNVTEENKALITWARAVVGEKVTFQHNGKYLKGKSSTDLILEEGETGLYLWDKDTYTMTIGQTIRTFLYKSDSFRNFAANQASNGIAEDKDYSSLPVVATPVYSAEEFVSVYTRSELPVGSYGTICLPYAVNNYTGATFYEVAGKEGNKIVFDEVTELEAGKPYIFMAEAAEIKLAQVGEAAIEAGNHNSLQGTFTQIDPAEDNILVGNYMVVNNVIKKCGINCGLKANRAYFVATELESLGTASAQMPGRRRVTMGVTGENEATGVDNITENGVIAPKKLIENGQLIIIRDGVKYNVQGVRL